MQWRYLTLPTAKAGGVSNISSRRYTVSEPAVSAAEIAGRAAARQAEGHP